MPRTNKPSHVHKFKRIEWGKSKQIVFRCLLPGCPTYIHLPFAEGRKSLCWKCMRPFTLDKEAVRRVKPTCLDCRKANKRSDDIDIDQLLKGIL